MLLVSHLTSSKVCLRQLNVFPCLPALLATRYLALPSLTLHRYRKSYFHAQLAASPWPCSALASQPARSDRKTPSTANFWRSLNEWPLCSVVVGVIASKSTETSLLIYCTCQKINCRSAFLPSCFVPRSVVKQMTFFQVMEARAILWAMSCEKSVAGLCWQRTPSQLASWQT